MNNHNRPNFESQNQNSYVKPQYGQNNANSAVQHQRQPGGVQHSGAAKNQGFQNRQPPSRAIEEKKVAAPDNHVSSDDEMDLDEIADLIQMSSQDESFDPEMLEDLISEKAPLAKSHVQPQYKAPQPFKPQLQKVKPTFQQPFQNRMPPSKAGAKNPTYKSAQTSNRMANGLPNNKNLVKPQSKQSSNDVGNLFLSGMSFDSSDDDGNGGGDEDILKFAFD